MNLEQHFETYYAKVGKPLVEPLEATNSEGAAFFRDILRATFFAGCFVTNGKFMALASLPENLAAEELQKLEREINGVVMNLMLKATHKDQ